MFNTSYAVRHIEKKWKIFYHRREFVILVLALFGNSVKSIEVSKAIRWIRTKVATRQKKLAASAALASVSRDYNSRNSGPGAKHVVHRRNN